MINTFISSFSSSLTMYGKWLFSALQTAAAVLKSQPSWHWSVNTLYSPYIVLYHPVVEGGVVMAMELLGGNWAARMIRNMRKMVKVNKTALANLPRLTECLLFSTAWQLSGRRGSVRSLITDHWSLLSYQQCWGIHWWQDSLHCWQLAGLLYSHCYLASLLPGVHASFLLAA